MLELITTLATGPAHAVSRSSSRRRLSWVVVAATLLLGASAAQATPIWSDGDLTTYGQVDWSVDPGGLLTTNYYSVYSSTFGVLQIGIPGTAGYSASFLSALHVLDYLPASGPDGAFDVDLIDPDSTSAGTFGGVVLALQLDTDFSDAGVMPANSSVPFGDLVLTNYTALPSLNGMTVRDILGLSNTLLGGGSNGYSISDIGTVAAQLSIAFANGVPDTFARDHLMAPTTGGTTGVPEPSTLALFSIGLLGLVGIGTNGRRVVPRPCPMSS